ncbi:MAG: nucleoside-diphosphate kinase [Spirochaetales bacterium]|nr:MAG: nucleoside-diphosphate kinase [Spirochaetales bacterium]
MERSFAMLKPGVLQRRLVGEILSRIERKGLDLVAVKLMMIDRPLAGRHYAEHEGKPFYLGLIDYMTSAPVIALVIEGMDAVAVLRTLCGATAPAHAAPGTIRGDFGLRIEQNVIHASDSPASAAREIGLFFKDDEILAWKDGNDEWI